METPEHYAKIAMRNVRRSDPNVSEVYALLAVAAALDAIRRELTNSPALGDG